MARDCADLLRARKAILYTVMQAANNGYILKKTLISKPE